MGTFAWWGSRLLGATICWALIVGCSGDGSGQSVEIAPEEVECGSLSCSGQETCLVTQRVRPFGDAPDSHACIPTPAGCGGFELCDCPASRGELEGKPVTGCSLLGERSLYVTEVRCGERNCADGEFCLVRRDGTDNSAATLTMECKPLPGDCAADLCAEACRSAVDAAEAGRPFSCFDSEFARAWSVAPEG